jgi:hypothetical protein
MSADDMAKVIYHVCIPNFLSVHEGFRMVDSAIYAQIVRDS